MPRIKSTLTGEVSNVRGDIARELIKMGVATAIDSLEPEADLPVCGESHQDAQRRRLIATMQVNPAAPVWAVVTIPRPSAHDTAGKELNIQMEILGGVYMWNGDPKRANITVDWDGGKRYVNGFGRLIPEETLGRYTHLWKQNQTWRGALAPKEKQQASGSTDKFFSIPWLRE
jgi:hypothetical protein